MKIHFSGKYSDTDLKNMQQLTGLGKKILSPWLPWTILGITLIVFFHGLFTAYSHGQVNFQAILTPLIGPVCVLLLLFWVRFRQKRLQAHLKVEMDGVADETGILLKAAGGETHSEWKTFSHRVFTEDYAFFYPDAESYFAVPRAFFQDERDWAYFLDLAGKKVPE
ncbi:MAG: YcxB family protein [Acidobacteria bacterium]|nr:YcxB family protein [Acidobacteriota bacterium]